MFRTAKILRLEYGKLKQLAAASKEVAGKRGNEAFDVHANTYRFDADVVLCFRAPTLPRHAQLSISEQLQVRHIELQQKSTPTSRQPLSGFPMESGPCPAGWCPTSESGRRGSARLGAPGQGQPGCSSPPQALEYISGLARSEPVVQLRSPWQRHRMRKHRHAVRLVPKQYAGNPANKPIRDFLLEQRLAPRADHDRMA